ncbi:MAG: FecR domain-containing protein [Rhodocyclaceae bacterium]|nr:FecR domain-containing protein [Rhodocyclaceae bacterium]
MRSQYGLRRLVAVALVLFALPAFAGVGIITHLSGVLTAKRADGTSKVLGIKSEVEQGDTLTTEADTYARIKFVDGAEVVLRPGTQFKIEKYAYTEGAPDSDNIIVSMFKGGLRAVTGLIGKRNKEKVSFQTPTATIGIRGTHFGMLLCNNDCANVPRSWRAAARRLACRCRQRRGLDAQRRRVCGGQYRPVWLCGRAAGAPGSGAARAGPAPAGAQRHTAQSGQRR